MCGWSLSIKSRFQPENIIAGIIKKKMSLFKSAYLPGCSQSCSGSCACSTTGAISSVFDGKRVVQVYSDVQQSTKIPFRKFGATFDSVSNCNCSSKQQNIDNVFLGRGDSNSKPYEKISDRSYQYLFDAFSHQPVPELRPAMKQLIEKHKPKFSTQPCTK